MMGAESADGERASESDARGAAAQTAQYIKVSDKGDTAVAPGPECAHNAWAPGASS